VGDDFTRALGDPLEGRLDAALDYRQSQTCPAPSGINSSGFTKPFDGSFGETGDGIVNKSPWLTNRWLEGA
jgi:hypothetical protein